MTAATTTRPTRQLQIEFLFLDLDTRTRCRATDATLLEAIEQIRPALDAAGMTVSLTKTRVATETQARQLRFVSSPTIRIDGVDIGVDAGSATLARPQPPTVPDNLRQYFYLAAAAAPVADAAASDCCTADVQAGCCEPEGKAACCGTEAGMASSSCGCHAGP